MVRQIRRLDAAPLFTLECRLDAADPRSECCRGAFPTSREEKTGHCGAFLTEEGLILCRGGPTLVYFIAVMSKADFGWSSGLRFARALALDGEFRCCSGAAGPERRWQP